MIKYQLLQVDTDGLHLGVSDISRENNKQEIVDLIKRLEKKWQGILNYSDFSLDIDYFDFMFNVVHKNYLYGKLDKAESIKLKGNNLKAKNKSKLSEDIVKIVINRTVKEIGNWELLDKVSVREKVKSKILSITQEEIDKININEINIEKLLLYENIKSISSYKKAESVYALRTMSIEILLNEKINHMVKLPMLVCKEPLPNIPSDKISKKGTKALHHMYPQSCVTSNMIDFQWYKDNILNYIIGAFGLKKQKTAKSKTKKLSSGQFTFDKFM